MVLYDTLLGFFTSLQMTVTITLTCS